MNHGGMHDMSLFIIFQFISWTLIFNVHVHNIDGSYQIKKDKHWIKPIVVN